MSLGLIITKSKQLFKSKLNKYLCQKKKKNILEVCYGRTYYFIHIHRHTDRQMIDNPIHKVTPNILILSQGLYEVKIEEFKKFEEFLR